nr:hypothetical protein [Mimivirus sp.]
MNYTNIDEYKKYINNIENEDWTSCWNYARWIHFINNIEWYDDIYQDYPNEFTINIINKSGIYSLFLENNLEFHHFVLDIDITNDQIKLYSCYGGKGFVNKILSKNKLTDLLSEIISGNVNSYNKLFSSEHNKKISNVIIRYLKIK